MIARLRFLGVAAVWLALPALTQAEIMVACSPERPTAWPGEVIVLKAWASSDTGQPLSYTWMAAAGQLESSEAEARWDLADVRRGNHTAIVRVSEPGGAATECSLQLTIQRGFRPRDPGPSPQPGPVPRETGWGLLTREQMETPGYGLYSYLLFGSPPGEGARERYQKAIEAYLTLVPDVASLERYIQRRELNIAYLPVDRAPDQPVSVEWALTHYDYARARVVLRALRGTYRDGPYIVSSLTPLTAASGMDAPARQHLYQDLSLAPPHLVSAWTKEFLNQAAQERFWEQKTTQRLALKLRLSVGILATGLPEVRKALDTWIAWSQ
jgi:hypothetical protein